MWNRRLEGVPSGGARRRRTRACASLAGWSSAYAADDPPTFPYGDVRMRELQRRSATDAAHRPLEDVAASCRRSRLETRIMFGDPGEALTSLCGDSDAALLVLGATARSGLAAACAGASRLVSPAQAGCPVVAVSPDAAERFLSAQHAGDAVVRDVDGPGEPALQLAGVLANAA